MKKVKKYLKELFCRHNYDWKNYIVAIDRYVYEEHPKRRYECTKCGKVIWIEAAKDPYNPLDLRYGRYWYDNRAKKRRSKK